MDKEPPFRYRFAYKTFEYVVGLLTGIFIGIALGFAQQIL